MTKYISILAVMCAVFAGVMIWATAPKYEGYVVQHTDDSLIIEVEVKVSPEELIGYEDGDPYILGGK